MEKFQEERDLTTQECAASSSTTISEQSSESEVFTTNPPNQEKEKKEKTFEDTKDSVEKDEVLQEEKEVQTLETISPFECDDDLQKVSRLQTLVEELRELVITTGTNKDGKEQEQVESEEEKQAKKKLKKLNELTQNLTDLLMNLLIKWSEEKTRPEYKDWNGEIGGKKGPKWQENEEIVPLWQRMSHKGEEEKPSSKEEKWVMKTKQDIKENTNTLQRHAKGGW